MCRKSKETTMGAHKCGWAPYTFSDVSLSVRPSVQL